MKIDLFNHFFPKRFFEEFVHRGAAFKDMGKRVQNIPSLAEMKVVANRDAFLDVSDRG